MRRVVFAVVAGLTLSALVVHSGRIWASQARGAAAGQQDRGRIAAGDWPTYNRDLAGTRYSPLAQINPNNVAQLEPAWSYRLRPEPGASFPRSTSPRAPSSCSSR